MMTPWRLRLAHAAFVCLCLGCRTEGDPSNAKTAEDSIRNLVILYDSVWQRKDIPAVERLLSPEYEYVNSAGGLTSHAATLEFLRDTSYRLDRSHRSELAIVVVGPVARVSSRWEGNGRYRGEPVQDDQTCGQTWILSRGNWQLFTEHCVNRPTGKQRT